MNELRKFGHHAEKTAVIKKHLLRLLPLCGKIYFNIVTKPDKKIVNYSIFNQNITFYAQSGNNLYWFWIPNAVKLFRIWLDKRVSVMYQGRENDMCPLMKYSFARSKKFLYLCYTLRAKKG